MQRRGHIAEANSVLWMPLENGSTQAHPPIEAFPARVERFFMRRTVLATFAELVDTALGEAGDHKRHIRFNRVAMQGIPARLTHILGAGPGATG